MTIPKKTPQFILGNVRANLSILTRDGSRGAHNFECATKIMNQAGIDLGEVKAAIK